MTEEKSFTTVQALLQKVQKYDYFLLNLVLVVLHLTALKCMISHFRPKMLNKYGFGEEGARPA